MKIVWKIQKGAHVSVSADVLGKELTRIKDSNDGVLKPSDVVHESKPKDAPLHNEFEWNNAKAAAKYRNEQGRYIIRASKYDVIGDKPESKPVELRSFVSTELKTEDSKPVFVSIQDASTDPDMRHEMLYKAHKKLIGVKKDLSAIIDLVDIISDLGVVIDKVDRYLDVEESSIRT